MMLGLSFWKLRKSAVRDREWYAAQSQLDVMKIRKQCSDESEANKLILTAKIAELSVQISETKRLMDERERARDRRIADMELVLKTRLRFQP